MIYFPCKCLIAHILLLSQLLTSCWNPRYLRMGMKEGSQCSRCRYFTWPCYGCPVTLCSCCKTHCNKNDYGVCSGKEKLMQQLQQQRQNLNQLCHEQKMLEGAKEKQQLLEKELMREEEAFESYSQKKRSERRARSFALLEELADKKQAIYRQSSLDEAKIRYNKFISNLTLEVPLKENGAQDITTTTDMNQSDEKRYDHLENCSGQPLEESSPFSDDCPTPTIHPALPLRVGLNMPASISYYKQIHTFSGSSDSGRSSGEANRYSEDANFGPKLSSFSSSSLEDLSALASISDPIPLKKSASLDNLLSAYSVKASLLSAPSPLTRLLTYYSLHLSPSAYLLLLRETGKLIEKAPLSAQQHFIDHLVNGGQLYPDIIKDYPHTEWLVRSLVQEVIQDRSGKPHPITLEQFSKHWTNISKRYQEAQQVKLLNALWEAKKKANLTLLQLTHILEIVSTMGQTGYEVACSEQPDKWIHLKNCWLSDQIKCLSQFSSYPEAYSRLTDALSRTHLSPSFIQNLLSAIREEGDLASLLEFLKLISKRKVPELIVSSIIYAQDAPLAISKSKTYQWLTALRCTLSLMHLSKIDAHAADAIAPILYDQIKQDPKIAPSLEAFIYSRSDAIVKNPSTFIALLELIHNYQIQAARTAFIFDKLLEAMPSEWIAKADQLITGKLFEAQEPYRVEALIAKMVASAPCMLYSPPSPNHAVPSSDYLKKTTIEKVLTDQVTESLKPVMKAQLLSVIDGYAKALADLENSANGLRENIKKIKTKRSDLSTCFQINKQTYQTSSAALKAEAKVLTIEIDNLIKENEQDLKKSEALVKKSKEQLGEQAEVDAATPLPVPTNQSKNGSKLAQLEDRLSSVLKKGSNLRTSYQVNKEAYEASSSALFNQTMRLEVDLLKLEQNRKPIKLKIENLSQEDATNFSDYSLYKEVLDNLFKVKPILRTADNKPFNRYSPSALTRWSEEIKRKKSSLFSAYTISEIITGINQASMLSHNTRLTKSQHVDLLRALFPFCKQSTIQHSKDPLVVIFLATICAIQNGQVALVTDSTEWPISESAILSYLPLFEILDLTVTKIDSTDPSSSCTSPIVYGKRSDFAAIPRLLDYNSLQQIQQRIDNCYHAPSALLQSADSKYFYGFKHDPIAQWTKSAVGQWANYVQHRLPKLTNQETLLLESIAVTEHAATYIQGVPLTPNQRYGLLTLLYPNLDKGQLLQKAQKDDLVAAMFAAIRSLQAQQSDVTPSARLAGIRPLFDLLNLTLSYEKIDTSTISTLLRLAASAPVTWHELEAHYSSPKKAEKAKKTLTTPKDSPNRNAHLPDGVELDKIAVYEQLKKQYDAIQAGYQSPSGILKSSSLPFRAKPIAQWNQAETKAWATYVQSHYEPGLAIELIAGVQHAVKLHYRFSPRPTQLLALLALLHPTYNKGRLAQINTGEGKSLIVAMLAAIHGLQGKQVDVITTSHELSIPAVKETMPFFQLLNLSVSENSSSNYKAAVYKHQIVYGTASDFQADILRQEFLGENTRGDRGYDIVLVDEVDSLLFDNRSHSVRLGSSHPGMDHLKPALGTIWQYMQWITDHMFEYKGTVYFTGKDSISPDADITTDKSIIPIQEDKRTFITRMTQVYLAQLLRSLDPTEAQAYKDHCEKRSEIAQVEQKIKSIKDEGGTAQEAIQLRDTLAEELHNLPWSQRPPILDIPDHLRAFARIQLPSWINNCLNAIAYYKKKVHYTVSKAGRIVPVAYNETGVLQHDLVWSDGLCQFLQIKEGLSVEPEGISTNAFSNIGFFKRYGNAIYGLTGTLGESTTRSFLEELYGVDFVVIPPYQGIKIQDNSDTPYLCKALRPILVEEKDWFPAILYQLLHHAKQGRAVLAICKYIWHAEYLEKQLKAHYDSNKVFTYTGITTLKSDQVNSGDIILATNIAGRGTDLKTTQEVEDKGGMYVAITFLPETNRVELQNVGRTARSGKKGMAQLILSNPDGKRLEALKAARQAKEIAATERALQEAKKILAEDALLEHFCSVTNTYLPSASDCESMHQAATILPKWNQILKTRFTDRIIDEQFQKSVTKSKQAWHNLFSSDDIPYSNQLDKDLLSKRDAFKSAYKNKLLEDFQSAHPMLPPSLLSCLQQDKPFKPNRSVLAEKYDWGSFERKAVEERWGIWLKAQQARAGNDLWQDILPVFQRLDDAFVVELAKDAHADQLIQNPYFYTLKGNKLLADGRAKDADICYDRAIALDPIFSLHSHYNKARALLSCKENKGDHQKKAYQALETAKNLIYSLYRPNLIAFHGLIGHGKAKTDTVIAIQNELDIVSQQEKYIQQALEVLDDTGATRHTKPANVALTNQSLRSTFKDPDASISHDKSIHEAALKGLSDLFTIKKVPPYPLFSIISMALISLSQIAVGCLLTAYGGVQLGMSLIKNGINDMVTTIKSAFKGSFDWGAWAIQKGVEIIITVASYGIKIAKEAIKGVTTTAESVKQGMLSAKQAVKDILGGKRLEDITIRTATAEIQKSPQQIVQETLTTQLKKRAMGELIGKTSQCLADELWVKQQAKKIRSAVKKALTKAFTDNPLITIALQLDRAQQNSTWQQCFLGEAQKILGDILKSDPVHQQLKQIGKGIVHNTVPYSKETEGVAGGLHTIRQSLSETSDITTPLAKKFIEAFTKRIATYKSDIEQSNQQEHLSRSNQTIAMAEPPLAHLDNEDVIITQVDDIRDFKATNRSAHQISLEENFPNLGPSTPENLVSALEEYICGATILNLNDAIMSGVSYGANWVNDQLLKNLHEAHEKNQENQKFLNALAARGINRYIDLKQEKQQDKIAQQLPNRNKQEDKKPKEQATASTDQPNDQAIAKKQVMLDPHTQKAIIELQEGDPLTRAHIRMVAHLLAKPIRLFDESGAPLGEDIGGYKSGAPILLRLVRGRNGRKDHIEPMHLTPAQIDQYQLLNQTKNNCVLNALFVHLTKENQAQLRSPEGLRQATADYMQAHPELCRDLFKYQDKLSQLAPAQVPRMGFLPIVKSSVAAWATYQCWQPKRDIAHNRTAQASWKKGK